MQDCICQECGYKFTAPVCRTAECPKCENEGCDVLAALVIAERDNQWCIFDADTGTELLCYASKEDALASAPDYVEGSMQCECLSCGAIFWAARRCDQSSCPVCGEQDDLEELTGNL